MLQDEYEKLVEYLEEMIADGCQLVHGGNLIDWSDTKINNIIKKIKMLRDKQSTPNQKRKQLKKT